MIHDAVGDEAEVMFGAVSDAAMQGEIRVTVIATGFDRSEAKEIASRPGVIPFPPRAAARQQGAAQAPAAAMGGSSVPAALLGTRRVSGSAQPAPHAPPGAEPLADMEIPTFIRRQMD